MHARYEKRIQRVSRENLGEEITWGGLG